MRIINSKTAARSICLLLMLFGSCFLNRSLVLAQGAKTEIPTGVIGLAQQIAKNPIPMNSSTGGSSALGLDDHFVSNTRAPDDYLALRTDPSVRIGARIEKMPNGTRLIVLQRQPDGWWYVQSRITGNKGWAFRGPVERPWINCCLAPDESKQQAMAPSTKPSIAAATSDAHVAALPPEIQSSINDATKSCGQKVELDRNFITRRDINGDGIDDFILDFGAFICGQNRGSDYCGSGGCLTQIFASLSEAKFVKAFDDIIQSIKFAELSGRPALVLALHGSACDKAGFEPCSKTLLWNGKNFSPSETAAAPPSEAGSKSGSDSGRNSQGDAVQGPNEGGASAGPARMMPPRLPSPGTESIGQWEYITTVDKLTDMVGFIAALKSIDGKYTLAIKCDNSEKKAVYTMLLAPIYLGESREYLRSIKYRLDRGPVTEEQWHFEGSYGANFEPPQAKNFALKLMRSARLVMQAYTWNFSNSVEPEFDVSDSETVIRRVLTDCKSSQ